MLIVKKVCFIFYFFFCSATTGYWVVAAVRKCVSSPPTLTHVYANGVIYFTTGGPM